MKVSVIGFRILARSTLEFRVEELSGAEIEGVRCNANPDRVNVLDAAFFRCHSVSLQVQQQPNKQNWGRHSSLPCSSTLWRNDGVGLAVISHSKTLQRNERNWLCPNPLKPKPLEMVHCFGCSCPLQGLGAVWRKGSCTPSTHIDIYIYIYIYIVFVY